MSGELDVLLAQLDQLEHAEIGERERQRLADLLPRLAIAGPWHEPTQGAGFMVRDMLGTGERAVSTRLLEGGYKIVRGKGPKAVSSEKWPLTDEGHAAARLTADRQLYRDGIVFSGDDLLWQIARRCVELGEYVGFAAYMVCRARPERSIAEISFRLRRDARMRLLLRRWKHERAALEPDEPDEPRGPRGPIGVPMILGESAWQAGDNSRPSVENFNGILDAFRSTLAQGQPTVWSQGSSTSDEAHPLWPDSSSVPEYPPGGEARDVEVTCSACGGRGLQTRGVLVEACRACGGRRTVPGVETTPAPGVP